MALTFFGVAWCVLAGVTNHPIQVSGSVLQHVVPGGDRENRNKNIKRNRGEAEVTVNSGDPQVCPTGTLPALETYFTLTVPWTR